MGCGESREPKEEKKSASAAKKENSSKPKSKHHSDRTSHTSSTHENNSLAIPLPDGTRAQQGGDTPESRATPNAKVPQTASDSYDDREPTFSPARAWIDHLANESFATTSSAPRLFRLEDSPTAAGGAVDWQWWFEEVRRDGITKDGTSRRLLQDLPNRLTCQHDEDPSQVELNLSTCYFERAAPYALGQLFAATHLAELRWVTSLRLDGNYVADAGFGAMLSSMAQVNEQRTVLPHLEQLYLNNMNLDARTMSGLLFYLFPYETKQITSATTAHSRKHTRRASGCVDTGAGDNSLSTLAGQLARRPSEDFAPFDSPTQPLFPSLTFLSVSENHSLGVAGLQEMLRSFLLVHYQTRVLSMLDVSWCDIDESAVALVTEFAHKAFQAEQQGRHPVVPSSFVLMGNPLGREAYRLEQSPPSAADPAFIRFVV